MRLNVMSWEIPKQLASGNWILGLFNTCRAVLFKGLSFRHDDLLGQILSRARYYPVSSHLQRIKPVGRGSARIGIVTADAGGTLSEVPLATLSGGQAANATDSCIRCRSDVSCGAASESKWKFRLQMSRLRLIGSLPLCDCPCQWRSYCMLSGRLTVSMLVKDGTRHHAAARTQMVESPCTGSKPRGLERILACQQFLHHSGSN